MDDDFICCGRSSVPKKIQNFRCPICQSTKYSQVVKSNSVMGPGNYTWLERNTCDGCSVHFQDAEKFTAANR